MFSNVKRNDLLILLAVLLFVKFVIVPTQEWQSQVLASNGLKTKKLSKSAFAINNQQLLDSELRDMQQALQKVDRILFAYAPENDFQLKQQQWLEQQFNQKDLELSNVGWQIQVPLADWPIIQHQVQVSFSGKASAVQQLQVLLESQNQWIEIIEFNYRFGRKRSEKLGEIGGYMTLRFFMRAES